MKTVREEEKWQGDRSVKMEAEIGMMLQQATKC